MEETRHFGNIVLNIPHSSDNIPVNTWQGDITKSVATWTDWHTDKLFKPNSTYLIKPVVFPVSRFFCDFERLIDDPLEKIGQGIFYTDFDMCRRPMDHSLYVYARKLYDSHRIFISSFIRPDTLVIDCHSFPGTLAPDTDICIGYNEDWSKPSQGTIDCIVDTFLDAGYNVDINRPYSNSITPKDSNDYKSVMIEVNKKQYLNPDNTLNPVGYAKLNGVLNYLYSKLISNGDTGDDKIL